MVDNTQEQTQGQQLIEKLLCSESAEDNLQKLMNREEPMRDDEGIYDYENVVQCKLKIPDSKERQVIPELLQDVERIKELKSKVSREEAVEEIESEHMRYLLYDRKTLRECVPVMFERLGLIEKFKIDKEKLNHLVKDVSIRMKRVPYHNFTHAFNIMHMCYIIIRKTHIRDYIDDVDVLSCLIGALGHDLDHPGFNNIYFVKLRHPIALKFNDQGVLENYHAYMLTKLLSDPKNDILSGLSPEELWRFRKSYIEAILGTEMLKHVPICGKFNDVVKKIQERTFDKTNQDERNLILKVVVHACDISSPTMNMLDFKSQGLRVNQEFHDQFTSERDNESLKSNPPPPYLEWKSIEEFYPNQIHFTKTFSLPIIQQLAEAFPQLQILVNKTNENLQQFEKEINKLQ